jgi:hypothetical protein
VGTEKMGPITGEKLGQKIIKSELLIKTCNISLNLYVVLQEINFIAEVC